MIKIGDDGLGLVQFLFGIYISFLQKWIICTGFFFKVLFIFWKKIIAFSPVMERISFFIFTNFFPRFMVFARGCPLVCLFNSLCISSLMVYRFYFISSLISDLKWKSANIDLIALCPSVSFGIILIWNLHGRIIGVEFIQLS